MGGQPNEKTGTQAASRLASLNVTSTEMSLNNSGRGSGSWQKGRELTGTEVAAGH